MSNTVNMCPVDYVAAATVRIGSLERALNKAYHMVNPEKYGGIFTHVSFG